MKCNKCGKSGCDLCGHCLCGRSYWGEKWINIEDELPKEDSFVLCIDSEKNINLGKYSSKFLDFFFLDDPLEEENKNNYAIFTHWMPLPKPPQEQ